MSNLTRLPELLQQSYTRRILWHQCAKAEVERELRRLLEQLNYPPEQCALLSERKLAGLPPIKRGEFVRHLGLSYLCVVVDAFSGLNPSALAQAAGTLKGGGVLILLTPKAERWADFYDPEYAYIGASDRPAGHFIQWLKTHLEASPAVVLASDRLEQNQSPARFQPEQLGVYLGGEQRSAVLQLLVCWRQHKSCTLIDADRGRGKSSALGLALALQSSFNRADVVVTAPDKRALSSLNRAFSELLPDAVLPTYLTPAQLLERNQKPLCLLIDEAAALPLPVLQKLVDLAPHVVLASTQHGYEGFGRGYGLRFTRSLEESRADVRRITLSQPLRWATGDPLEAWVDGALLLNQDDLRSSMTPSLKEGVMEVRVELLLQQPNLFTAIYQLLAQAHYRTSPADLRVLLDSEGQRLFIDVREGQLVAVAWVAQEGPIEPKLAQLIAQGRRRPAGNLLPQSLIYYEGWVEAASQRFWRVVRIAVSASCRRQGVARRLIEHMKRVAQQESVDLLGASFAGHDDLLRFWQQLDFHLMRVGEVVDPVAAAPAAQVLQALNPVAERLISLFKGVATEPADRAALEQRNSLALHNFAHHFAPLKLVENALLDRFNSQDFELLMAVEQGGKLSSAQIKRLRHWVAERL